MKHPKTIRFVISALLAVFVLYGTAYAVSYLTYVSDVIATSAPGQSVDQVLRFTLEQSIPPSGAIELQFTGGGFTIPSTGFNFGDVDIGFSGTRGGPYTQRPVSSIATAGTDGVTVTTGSSGMIRIQLNSSVGIPAGNEIEVRLGTNASYGAIGDTSFVLDTATGSYPVYIRTFDVSNDELDYGATRISINTPVLAGPVDTTDQDPPIILVAEPTGLLQVGTQGVEMYLLTNELANCKFATSSMSYALMPYLFYGTTSGLVWNHFAQVTGLEDDTTYTYYIRCVDFRNNEMDPDYVLEFTIGIPPGSATTTSTSTGSGTGTGNSSTTVQGGPGTGDDVGTGGGPTGSGSGDGPIGGDGAGSGSGGSGGGDGQGTNLAQAAVQITGWAYPNAPVSFVRDGVLITIKNADADGRFSHLMEGLDRGSYSFAISAADDGGTRSASFSTTLWLRSNTLNSLSNVMLPPTISATDRSVEPGAPLVVNGYSAPEAHMTVWLRPKLAEVSTGDIVATTTALGSGAWTITLPTSGLSRGTYELVAQGTIFDGTIESDKSARMTVGVGVDVSSEDCGQPGDLNCDGFVNLIDFSILLFNWNTTDALSDINDDGLVSLPDFSIMLFYWTG
jgi:hypothetical protein